MTDPAMPPRTLKVDAETGRTLKSWVTPGSGLYGNITPRSTPSGGHGLKWVDGKYWMAVPASGKLFLMEPETGDIVRSVPAPGVRTGSRGTTGISGAWNPMGASSTSWIPGMAGRSPGSS